MLQYIFVFLKGIAMGAANVIPGVSGGTIALITGIFERIINSIKSLFSMPSFRLFFKGKWKEWAKHTDFIFLMVLGLGIVVAIGSLAKLLEYLFAHYPVFVWAFFFGLVFASVYFVAKTIKKWNFSVILFFVAGIAIAVMLAVLKPLGENRDVVYLIICGVVAACSMILPGLSGSFVLVLMGNYELVMIQAINNLELAVLLPVIVGAGVGLLGFSYVLAWVFKKFRDQTISLLSGFMLGSLLIIWPWKQAIWKTNAFGEIILNRSGDKIVEKYIWTIPEQFDMHTIYTIGFIVLGVVVIALTEIKAGKKAEA